MCLIILAHRQHHSYPLLVAANRDEYYQRPTEPAQIWPESGDLLAGKDLTAGGTWLGITRAGRFAAITNHRNPPTTPSNPRSRGLLTLDYLRGSMSPGHYLRKLAQDGAAYAGFNLLLGDGKELYYYSNIEGVSQRLAPGIYGVSNALLNTPWPKLKKGCQRLQRFLHSGEVEAHEQRHAKLAEVVSDRALEPDHALPDTGVGTDLERLLSAQFICSEEYGTRATTTVLVREDGGISFSERSFRAGGVASGMRCFELSPGGGE
ncbi:MAG: NRDE family protein [Gammaproteobacteria bacterium]|nr:NRDE family protein [Gammaproteobacteria bacterium]